MLYTKYIYILYILIYYRPLSSFFFFVPCFLLSIFPSFLALLLSFLPSIFLPCFLASFPSFLSSFLPSSFVVSVLSSFFPSFLSSLHMFSRRKIKDKNMFFRRKTKENHAKSVQHIRKLLFSLGKTKEKQKTFFFVGKPRKITPNPSKT